MTIELKKWAGLGLGTLVLGAGLAACGQENGEGGEASHGGEAAAHGEMSEGEGEGGEAAHGETGEGEGEAAAAGEAGEGEGEGGESGADVGALPLPNRLAFMSGHVEAGLALYRAGEPEMAAKHLLHPVSETHAAERAGLGELGFEPALFEVVSQALEEGRPASEIEPQLAAAEANLAMVTERAGGDPIEIIEYLMDVVVEEYAIAITDGQVTDPGEYQDAYGFAVVARDRAATIDPAIDGLIEAIDGLIALWPENAPIPPADPAPVGQVTAQTSRVRLALPQRG